MFGKLFSRKKPGLSGKGKFYRVVVRPKNQFVLFRNHDVGEKGHIERLTGMRRGGTWATHAWLIDKREAEVKNGILVGKNADVREVLEKLRRKPRHIRGDIFEAGPVVNVREADKPTLAMRRAWSANIKKAQMARKKVGKKRKVSGAKKFGKKVLKKS
ncbi:MAG: hypothetical protein ABIF88_04005 [archaeon]